MFPSNENENENEKEHGNEATEHNNSMESESDLAAVNYAMFYDLLLRIVEKRKPDNLNNEIRKAFENLKDSEGKVLKRYLRNLLQNTGEKLSTEELSTIDKYPGEEITYAQFREIIEIPEPLDWTILFNKSIIEPIDKN